MRILLVEDETDTLQVLTTYLEAKGHVVISARDGAHALEEFSAQAPDIVLLDIRLPRLNGWEVLEAIRARSSTPVIVLTALDSAGDAVKGLSLGADDYLRKPFQLSELEARMQAVLRRTAEHPHPPPPLQIGYCRIDDRDKSLILNGTHIPLSPKEYELLKLLASDPGRVFSSEEIVARLWPTHSRATSSDVKQYIHLLRSKVEKDRSHPQLIETIKGFGYRLIPQRTEEDLKI